MIGVLGTAVDSAPRDVQPPLLWATAAGVLLGVAYAASPVTLWFLVTMAGLFAWAGRGLMPRERQWVWGLLAVGVALRLLVVAGLFLTSDPDRIASFTWDPDGPYYIARSLWMRNIRLGIPIPPEYFQAAFTKTYGWSTYLYVLACLQYLLGPAPYSSRFVNIALFVAAIVMLYRLARSAYGREPALVGLALLLFLPTLFAWSVSALKDPATLFLLALALVAAITALRSRPILIRAVGLAVLGGAIAVIDGVRDGGRVIAIGGLVSGLAGSLVMRRAWLVVLVPVLLIVAGRQALNDPDIQGRIMSQLRSSAAIHLGHVRTEGHGYTLLDSRFYEDTQSNTVVATMTADEGLRFVVRALVSVVIVPLPWQVQSFSEMLFLPQQVVWYALVVLALVGLVDGLRRDALVTCVLAGVAVVGLAAIAMNSGNIGTMTRHRDLMVPFVVWLSALGAVATVSTWRTARRQGDAACR